MVLGEPHKPGEQTADQLQRIRNFLREHYGVNDAGYIEHDQLRDVARKKRPRLILAGASAYPRIIDFVQSLPKTPAGKINRKILRDQEAALAAA